MPDQFAARARQIGRVCRHLQDAMAQAPPDRVRLGGLLVDLNSLLPSNVRCRIAVRETSIDLEVFFRRGRRTITGGSDRPYPKSLQFLASYVEEQFEDGTGNVLKSRHGLRGPVLPATKIQWEVEVPKAPEPPRTWHERLLAPDDYA